MRFLNECKIHRNYNLRLVTEKEINAIIELCQSCSGYFQMESGKFPDEEEAHAILTELPPNKTHKDKYVIGMYNEKSTLIALMDIVRDYPEEHVWMLGLLLVNPTERRKGLGQAFYHKIIKLVEKEDGQMIRIGVYEENEPAFKFWKALGFKTLKKVELERGNNRCKSVTVMTRRI